MSGIDPLIHAPARLRLCAMLSVVDEAQFATVRDRLGISDSVLSKHVSALTEARYVAVRKGVLDGRRTTWLTLTSRGRKAFADHVAALRAVIDDATVSG
nr:transcriptional regulator, ArsR family [Aeromicrobium sp.]